MTPTESRSLLFVEDDHTARNLIAQMIRMRFDGFTVYTAENGKEGLELFKRHTPQLVLTDINMPLMNGMQMAREIRALSEFATFIVLTAYGDEPIRSSFAEIGFCGFLRKPVVFEELFEVIKSCLPDCT